MNLKVRFAGGNTVTIDGTRAYGNSYLASSVIAFAAAGNLHC
jgi:hypothetical protein